MATAEKASLLKNMKIKILNPEEEKSSHSKKVLNISGSNDIKEVDKDSSKLSGEEDKEIIKLNMLSQDKAKNSNSSNNLNSKIIKEKPEETENAKNSNSNEESKSNFNDEESKKEENEESNSEENKTSSFLDSKHYHNMKEEEEMNDSKENGKDFLERKDPFMTTGKFMQIQPHFNIFSKRIETLRDGIYDNTKKCLIYKSCLQHSENLMREKANSVVKDLVEKIFNLRQMFIKSDKDINSIISETNSSVINLRNLQDVNRQDINECGHRIHKCEGKIGYKLLGKPNYSFMKKACQTVYNDNAKNK